MVVELVVDIEQVEFIVVGMVVVGKDMIVVENKFLDMDDMMFGD